MMQNSNHKVSIIVPIYNAEKVLKRCVDSLLKQTYSDIEVLLINDGSTDKSGCICYEYQQIDKRVKAFDKKNEGVSATRNFGISKSKGEYIVFVDSDDYVEENLCRILVDVAEHYNADICTCGAVNHVLAKNEVSMSKEDDNIDILYSNEYNYASENSHYVVWGALFKASTISKLRFKEDIFVGEDTLFFAQAVRNTKYIINIHQNLYHYMIYKESLSHGRLDEEKLTELEAWRQIMELNKDIHSVWTSCCAGYAYRCIEVLTKYENISEEKEIYKDIISKYRNYMKYLIYHKQKEHSYRKYISIMKYLLVFFMPTFYIKIFGKGGNKK